MKNTHINSFKSVNVQDECNGMECQFSVMSLKDSVFIDILHIKFFGEYREGSMGKPELGYMVGMVNLGIEIWKPLKVIIDIRNVKYEWGDDMQILFDEAYNSHIRTIIIVSDKNKYAIETLLGKNDIIYNELAFDNFEEGVDVIKNMKLKEWDNDLQQWQ